MRIQNKNIISGRCNFYNVGYCKYTEKGCMFKHPEEQCKEVKCSYKTCQKRHQKDCKWFLGESGCRHGNKCGFKHLIKKVVDEEYNLEEEIKSLKTAIMEKDESMKTLTNSIAVLDE